MEKRGGLMSERRIIYKERTKAVKKWSHGFPVIPTSKDYAIFGTGFSMGWKSRKSNEGGKLEICKNCNDLRRRCQSLLRKKQNVEMKHAELWRQMTFLRMFICEFKKKYGYDAYMDLIELTSHINTENNLKEINEYKVNILTDNQFVKGEKYET